MNEECTPGAPCRIDSAPSLKRLPEWTWEVRCCYCGAKWWEFKELRWYIAHKKAEA